MRSLLRYVEYYHHDVLAFLACRQNVRREVSTWLKLNHANITPFLGTSESFGGLPALISVWMPNRL
jgi:hypothetical protein